MQVIEVVLVVCGSNWGGISSVEVIEVVLVVYGSNWDGISSLWK